MKGCSLAIKVSVWLVQVPQGERGREPAAAARHAGHQGAAAGLPLSRCPATCTHHRSPLRPAPQLLDVLFDSGLHGRPCLQSSLAPTLCLMDERLICGRMHETGARAHAVLQASPARQCTRASWGTWRGRWARRRRCSRWSAAGRRTWSTTSSPSCPPAPPQTSSASWSSRRGPPCFP